MGELLVIALALGLVYGTVWLGVKFLTPKRLTGEEIQLTDADRQWLLAQGSFYEGLSRRNRRRFEERVSGVGGEW